MEKFDFSGWATKNDLLCADGRTIRKNAFKGCDGQTVPLVYNHNHSDPENVIGHALLENRDEGVYMYGSFNNSPNGLAMKEAVRHGDVRSLSIYANKLKQSGGDVLHGIIREVSLVMAGANPGAFIESVMMHGEDSDDGLVVGYDENIMLHCYPEESKKDEQDEMQHAEEKEDKPVDEEKKDKPVDEEKKDKTIQDVLDSMNEEQKTVMNYMIGKALEAADENDEGDDADMKHNVFDQDEMNQGTFLSHADQEEILQMAKSSNVGSLKNAIKMYVEEHKNTLSHGIEDIESLFPEFKDVHPGAPELIERDQSWVGSVIKKTRKSPYSRIRTRQADARAKEVRAKGYSKRESEKTVSADIKMIMRTTDPQTVYRRDELHRDDIVDITDFDVVAFQKTVMKHNMEEDVALAILVGDGREDVDTDKIHEDHIRPVWKDDDLYTIHYDIDMDAARAELQGTNTGANFGENYVRAEAMVNACLYSREQYKGKGNPDMYIEPHELNVMLLARDLNGRRIYDTKAELAKALNVNEIHTVEQFAGLTRTTKDNKTKKLLALMVNLGNYQVGCTRGGELTTFEDFDIDFNTHKYLMETRLSGALTELYSAIALEEDVTEAAAG